MSNNKKLTLEDLRRSPKHKVHWPDGLPAPKVDTSVFTTENEELGKCDPRAKVRLDGNHLLAGAEKKGDDTIIYHPNVVAEAFVKNFKEVYGNCDPRTFRCGATSLVKSLIDKEYRLIATLAFKKLTADYDAQHQS